jgi:hypothetical protein
MIRVFAVPRSIAMSLVKKSKNAMDVPQRFRLCFMGQLRMCAAKLHLIYQNTEAPLQKCKFFKQINRFEETVRVRFNPGFNLLKVRQEVNV